MTSLYEVVWSSETEPTQEQSTTSNSPRKKCKFFCLSTAANGYAEVQVWYQKALYQKRLNKKNVKRSTKPTPHYGGINYGSISEAALGILLEQLIPDFSVQEGRTFQLPLGNGRTVDFLIDNTLVEFHYPRFYSRGNDCGDFKNHKEKKDFLKALKRVGRNKHQKKKLLKTTHDLLIRNYTQKRRCQIDISLYGPHTELIVASTAEEFYWKVICRFAGIDKISEKEFVKRFNDCCKSVIQTSRQAFKRAA